MSKKSEIKVLMNDSRPMYRKMIHSYTTNVNVADLNDLIIDLWVRVSTDEIIKKKGKFSFEEVVRGCFQAVSKELELDKVIQIRKLTDHGEKIDYEK